MLQFLDTIQIPDQMSGIQMVWLHFTIWILYVHHGLDFEILLKNQIKNVQIFINKTSVQYVGHHGLVGLFAQSNKKDKYPVFKC